MEHLCLCVLFLFMLSRLFIAALWSPAGKGLTFWLLLVMFIVHLTKILIGRFLNSLFLTKR